MAISLILRISPGPKMRQRGHKAPKDCSRSAPAIFDTFGILERTETPTFGGEHRHLLFAMATRRTRRDKRHTQLTRCSLSAPPNAGCGCIRRWVSVGATGESMSWWVSGFHEVGARHDCVGGKRSCENRIKRESVPDFPNVPTLQPTRCNHLLREEISQISSILSPCND
jgi:hypothetical protein